ncbi:arabinose operon protein AraL [Bacillus sp. OV194]|nr:arabinose operon protein AraL [Bacillus sp. OV194]
MVRGYIFDLDGTVYLGDRLIPGSAEAIHHLKKRGDKVLFVTNKSIATRQDYVRKLRKLGIEVSLQEVINSNYIAAMYLNEVLVPGEKVLALGEAPLLSELQEFVIPLTENPAEAAYVVLGWDREFNYEKLNLAFQACLHQAKVIATNPDRTCPMENNQQLPDCGAMIGALEGATGKPIDLVVGKPSSYLAEVAVKKILLLEYENCYMIGDRLETDIKMANESGMNSVLALTGISNREMAATSPYKPKYILESIKDITSL